jgi:hypothetical protein
MHGVAASPHMLLGFTGIHAGFHLQNVPSMRRTPLSICVHSLNMVTETLQDRQRVRKNTLRSRERKPAESQGPGLWFPRFHLKPYENEQGYMVDPFYIKPAYKMVVIALMLAIFMAALKPPPFMPRNYLYQVNFSSLASFEDPLKLS